MLKKILGIIAVVAFIAFLVIPVSGDTNRTGDVIGKFRIASSGATLNATNTVTGTAFRIKDNLGFLSLFYQVTAGTSTPHYRIAVFTSPDGTNFTTLPEATATASSDETSTNLEHVSVSIPLTNFVRVDVVGVLLNATNTTFNLWTGDQ